MSGVGGFVGGVIVLSALEAVGSSSQATSRLGGAFTGAANLVRHLASPEVPLVPDLRPAAAGTSTSSATSAPSITSTTLTPANRFPATTRKA